VASYESTAFKNAVATSAGTNQMKYGALCTTAPSNSAFGTEVTSGSPAYARILASWGAASAGAVTATAMAFNVPASTTVVGFGTFDLSSAGTYQNGCDITSQTFASQGTYTITPTYTQS
jgi:hypothetical protein